MVVHPFRFSSLKWTIVYDRYGTTVTFLSGLPNINGETNVELNGTKIYFKIPALDPVSFNFTGLLVADEIKK